MGVFHTFSGQNFTVHILQLRLYEDTLVLYKILLTFLLSCLFLLDRMSLMIINSFIHMTDQKQTRHYRRYSGSIFCQSLRHLDSDYSSHRHTFSRIIRKWQIDLTWTAKLLSLIEVNKSWLHYGILISLEIVYKNSVIFCRELSKGGWIGCFEVHVKNSTTKWYKSNV